MGDEETKTTSENGGDPAAPESSGETRFAREPFVSVMACGDRGMRIRNERTGRVTMVNLASFAVFSALPEDGGATLLEIAKRTPAALDVDYVRAVLNVLRSEKLVSDASQPSGYDALAAAYDSRPAYGANVDAFLKHHIEPRFRRSILEVGCGTGALLEHLARLEPVELVGLDVSRPMLEKARERVASKGIRAELAHGIAEAMPFAARRFSAIALGHALHWFDRRRFWGEATRVLERDNRVVVVMRLPDPASRDAFSGALTRFWGDDWRRMALTALHGLPEHVGICHVEHQNEEMVFEDADAFVNTLISWAPLPFGRGWPERRALLAAVPKFPLRVPCLTTLAVVAVSHETPAQRPADSIAPRRLPAARRG